MPDYQYEYEYEHDLDRTQREFESALQELQPEHFDIPDEEVTASWEQFKNCMKIQYHLDLEAWDVMLFQPLKDLQAWWNHQSDNTKKIIEGLAGVGGTAFSRWIARAAKLASASELAGMFAEALVAVLGGLALGTFLDMVGRCLQIQSRKFEIPGEQEFFGETEAASIPYETGSYRAGFQYPSQEAEELELELAAELLEVTSEQELDRFLGDLFKKVGGFVSGAVKSPVFKALGGVLKPIAKSVLPMASKALGSAIGGPAGDVIGSNLASAAGNLFGLELEGLSGEDREFETAKGFVRLASGAAEDVKNMHYHPGHNPYHAAKTAVMRASKRHLGAEPSDITEKIDITTDTARPHPRAPGPQAPRPQAPGPQAPHPQAPGLQAPRPQAPRPQAPRPQAPRPQAPRPQATAPGPHATADGSSHPGATNGRAEGAHPGAPISEPWSSDFDGAPPLSHGDLPPEPLPAGAKRQGTWFRRGRRIILIGV